MKILFNSHEIRQLDHHTALLEKSNGIGLMERAGFFLAQEIKKDFLFGPNPPPALAIVAGPGNNGGDGLVLARYLAPWVQVKVCYLNRPEVWSPEFSVQIDSLNRMGNALSLWPWEAGNPLPDWPKEDLLVDALFGTGLKGDLRQPYPELVHWINNRFYRVLSIDVPSGFPSDLEDIPKFKGLAVKALKTYTVGCEKKALLTVEADPFVGEITCTRLPHHPLASLKLKAPSSQYLLEPSDLNDLIPLRTRQIHKGILGTGLMVGGSLQSPGALVLALKGMMRAGAGKGFALSPSTCRLPIQQQVPEIQWFDGGKPGLTFWPDNLPKASAIGIGPGMGTSTETKAFLKHWLQLGRGPAVLDADALNLLAEEPTWQRFLPDATILTPHPGEFDRLLGEKKLEPVDRWQLLPEFAKKTGAVVILKGGVTAVSSPNGTLYFCHSGSPALATGGSGDVLTGILTGLLAQGISPLKASLAGVLWHALAGKLYANNNRIESLLAGEIPNWLGKVFPNKWT